jgi:polyhydroxyalkanoate synthesis regulator phasin
MKIEKAHWQADGDNLHISMPLQKVDTERRIVSGFATLDNEDLHGDIVTKEASKKAFDRFRGNIRLMHQPIPAGKLVNFREEEYYDTKTEKFFSGIYVDAYISEGAPDVWKMVLDGTLTGFSIGGNVKDAESQFVKDAGKTVRFIKDYEMVELSLVDNPANQLSNIFSIQKTADGNKVEGMISKINAETVFYCKKDHDPVAVVGTDDEKTCVDCGSPMKNIGWFESDGGDRAEKVNSIIEKFEADSTEGGENMAKEETVKGTAEEEATQVESAEEVSPKGDAEVIAPEEESEESATATDVKDEQVTVTGTGEVKVEEAKEVIEPVLKDGEVDENPLTKMFDDLSKSIGASIDKSNEKTAELLAEHTSKFEKELGELVSKHNELTQKFGTLTEKFNNVEKSLSVVEESGAFKKSVDLGGDTEDSSIEKSNRSVWRGSIFSSAHIG